MCVVVMCRLPVGFVDTNIKNKSSIVLYLFYFFDDLPCSTLIFLLARLEQACALRQQGNPRGGPPHFRIVGPMGFPVGHFADCVFCREANHGGPNSIYAISPVGDDKDDEEDE